MSASTSANIALAPKSDVMTENRYLKETFPGGLDESDIFWRDHQEWLKERGYMLRSRWHPDWEPSWIKSKKGPKQPRRYEDGQRPLFIHQLLDARRISDGKVVILKKVKVRDESHTQPELTIGPSFGKEPYASDPRNRCIPIYEVLTLPDVKDVVLLAMPRLNWRYELFETVGEAVEFCRQMFEGLQFLHEHHIAHNDIKSDNIMMDSRPLYNADMHPSSLFRTYDWKVMPAAKSRTQRPVKYYYIDFDACERYDPSAGPPRRREHFGGDNTVPEFWHSPDEPYDPFAVDVYRIGNVVREKISGGAPVLPYDPTDIKHEPLNPSFAFMQSLISDMTQDDPSKRPNMEQVVSRFTDIVRGLSGLKLRSRIHDRLENNFDRLVAGLSHWPRQLYYVATRVPAIPTPK